MPPFNDRSPAWDKLPIWAVWVLGFAVLVLCAAFAAWIIPPTVRRANGDFLAFSDFFAQWSFVKFAQWGDVGRIYDQDALHRFQLTLEPALRQTFPYPYPPTYLFALWPLGWLPYRIAYLVWDAACLLLYLWAVFGARVRTVLFWFVLLAPVTTIALSQGQNGLLTSALMVGGMRLMRGRPVLGGVLIGLATFKPQLGMLIPLALIAAGYWRTFLAAAVTASVLALLSIGAFGWSAWPAWLHDAAGHAAYVDQAVSDYLKPSVLANLTLARLGGPVAHAVQGFVTVVVAVIVVLCFRRGVTDLSLAALQVGTFLAMPYTFRYDMPMMTNGILLLVRDRWRSGGSLGLVEAGIIGLGFLAPAVNTLTSRFFYVSGVSMVLLFGLIAWRRLGEARCHASQDNDHRRTTQIV